MAKQVYLASDAKVAHVMPTTYNKEDGTVDVVWYGGQTVPRMDPDTGDEYMLRLDMAGCRMDRLNNSAPVFDNHMTGTDFRSMYADKSGTRAQMGVVKKAWADGDKGMATIQFDRSSEDACALEAKVATGIVNNLSFGTWIYSKKPTDASGGATSNSFVADDWEPFEISPVTVPADFSTQFMTGLPSRLPAPAGVRVPVAAAVAEVKPLQAQFSADQIEILRRAISPTKETPVEPTTQVTGDQAQAEQVRLDAARVEGASQERLRTSGIRELGKTRQMDALAAKLIDRGMSLEDARTEFSRAGDIQTMAKPHLKFGIEQKFIDALVESGETLDSARAKLLTELETKGRQDATGTMRRISEFLPGAQDGTETRLACMQEAIVLRSNPKFYLQGNTNQFTGQFEFFAGCSQEQQSRRAEMAREYVGFSLIEMAREALELASISTRGMNKGQIADLALSYRKVGGNSQFFGGGAETTSDFPNILANLANKTLRQSYEAYPQTFRPFCRQTTAVDFKPVNRMQLNDLPALAPLNEKGEYRTSVLTDSGIGYVLAEYGGIVRITRRAIINDDLQAFTRTSATLGVAASQTQSNVVWGLLTANTQLMQDGKVIFHAAHNNLITGANSSLLYSTATDSTAALTAARAAMRQQKGPGGTFLNLIPRYIVTGTNQETPMLKMIAPTNIASSDVTKVVPDWVRSLVPISEPRLDPATGTTYPWLIIADPAQIDTIEYAFLEGQEGVYFETRQGFEVDGVEMKARMDFAAAAIDWRGLQKNAGA